MVSSKFSFMYSGHTWAFQTQKGFIFSPELPWRWHTHVTVGLSVSWLLSTYSTWLHILCRPWSKSALISITRPQTSNTTSDSQPVRAHAFNLDFKMSCMLNILYDFFFCSISVITVSSVMADSQVCASKRVCMEPQFFLHSTSSSYFLTFTDAIESFWSNFLVLQAKCI